MVLRIAGGLRRGGGIRKGASNLRAPTNADLGFVGAPFHAVTDQNAGTYLFTAQVNEPGIFGPQSYTFSNWRRTSGFAKLAAGTPGTASCDFTSNAMVVGDAGDNITCTISVDFSGPTSGTISATVSGVIQAPPGGIIFITSLGVRNWHASNALAANSIVQFGLPFALDQQLDPAGTVLTMTRDSDGAVIPTQIDLKSTRSDDGTLGYAVVTAKMPAVAAVTTQACTLTFNSGVYSGSAVATVADLAALDLKVTATGGDIASLATASFNDYVYRRAIKSGAVVCAWEGWSRFKEGGSPVGYWGVRWRAELSGPSTISRIDVAIYCSDNTSTPFGASARGRSIRPTLKAGNTTLNSDFAGADVWVSGNTGFKMYGSGDSLLPAYGGVTARPVHYRPYLEQCAAILPHRWGSADSDGVTTALGSFSDAYTPGGLGGFRTSWSGTGIDGTLGPYAGVSYNMLYDLSDDARWRKGCDAGLKQLGAAFHNYDPATGFHVPRFGSYSGLATAITGKSNRTSTTYSSSNATRMTFEDGHICCTAYIPALLTGEMYFVDALNYTNSMTSNRDQGYYRFQCSGRSVRYFPLIHPESMARYIVLPLRQLAHFAFICDDGRSDKAYAEAILDETEAFATDLFVDKLQWVKVSGTPADAPPGNKFASYDGTGTGGPYSCNIWTHNATAEFGNAARDSAWSCDYGVYSMWWLYRRNGRTFIKPLWEGWMSRYYIGRALGSGACVAFSAQYAALTQPNAWNTGLSNAERYAFVQTWGEYWATVYSGGAFVQRNGGVCPSTAAFGASYDQGYYTIYQSVMALMAKTDIGGAHSKTFRDVVNALGTCFAGGSGNAISSQPRWEIAL